MLSFNFRRLLHRLDYQFCERYYLRNDSSECMPSLLFAGILMHYSAHANYLEYFSQQKIELIDYVAKLTYGTNDNVDLQIAKQELLSQVNNLTIVIGGKDFFFLDRPFLAGVSSLDKCVIIKLNIKILHFSFVHQPTDGSFLLHVCSHFHPDIPNE